MNHTQERTRRGLKGWMLSIALGAIFLLSIVGMAFAEQAGLTKVDDAIASYAPPSNLTGNMVIAGSDTMQPLMLKLVSAFRLIHRDTKLAVQGGGTEKAVMQFLSDQSTIRRGDAFYGGHQVSGSVSLLASSRPLTHDEIEAFRTRYSYEPTEAPIALDAVAIYVNRENPIQGLTLEQVDAVFGADHKRGLQGDIATWGQLGLESWVQQPIHLYGRDKQSGTRTFFKHAALLDGDLKGTVREEPGSAMEILAISRDPLAIGYVGIGFQTSMVKAVPLAEKAGMPFVAPNAESAAGGSYPLGRALYLYVKKDPKEELEPVVLEFLKFVNSREGQRTVAKAGAYPLTAAQVAKNLQTMTGSAMAATATSPATN
ncbi:MAG: PstS family phosphate ABC transporter substrate-binding protein [Nitrospirae bacterium]|nr:PstS family phosphate ABC transporter substrate-binding protein [Nitrospirota bacterium]